ncbi:MAG: geranylgeranylglycerol-phosphate geranylgeranyltransferase [Halobacteriales archaeon]|nr:geranylgeranylglycerol-phosphate geranylgeranyltransferase [Halobacteriales archaeon]
MAAPSFEERLRGVVGITRPINAIVAGVLTFIGAFVATDAFLTPASMAAVVATILATGAGNTINDYFDREIDRINAPDRPIPSGTVTPREALLISGVLFAVAIVVALVWLPRLAILVAVLNLIALIAYTPVFKARPAAGNLVVAYLGGSTFLFGGLAVGNPGPTLVLSVLAVLSTMTREIVKDIEDMAGDEAEGLDTLPLRIGAERSLWIGIALLVVALVASPLPYLVGIFGPVYLGLVAIADALFVYAGYRSFSDPTAGQTYLKYGMFLSAGAFILGRLAVL